MLASTDLPAPFTLTGRLLTWATSRTAGIALLALAATALLTWLGVSILEDYHQRAHHHYDSAAYRYSSILVSQQSKGARWATALNLLWQKDSLDVVLRLMVFRRSLEYYHGHLFVQVPFMALFFFLALYYVHQQANSLLYGTAALSCVLIFGACYHPVQGLMDYWKENLAVWLLGGALLSWFLSEGGTRRGWSMLSGVLWSLLALQRVVLVVYGAAILLPFLIVALAWRIRHDNWRKICADALAFGLVPAIVATFMAATQARSVYEYYAVAGYGYDTPLGIANWLFEHPFNAPLGFRLGLLGVIAIPTLGLLASRPPQIGRLVAGIWLVVALPALVIATKAMYHSFHTVLLVLTITAVCRLVPTHLSAPSLRKLSIALLAVSLVAGMAQSRYYAARMEQLAQTNTDFRQLFRNLGVCLATRPPNGGVGFFFDEDLALVEVQLFYDKGVRIAPATTRYFMSTHDSYYTYAFPGKSPEAIATEIISKMEEGQGGMAVVHADPEDYVRRIGGIYPDAVHVQVNTRIIRHVQASPNWKATRYLHSEYYGPLLVFQQSNEPLSPHDKWAALHNYSGARTIPLSMAVAPAVQQVFYTAPPACPPESINGTFYQWIPSGNQGVSFSVLVERPIEVSLRAGIIPGPSKAGTRRTVLVRHGEEERRFVFPDKGQLDARLWLVPGLNRVEILSADVADLPPPPRDTRPLMFHLESPHLLPVSASSERVRESEGTD